MNLSGCSLIAQSCAMLPWTSGSPWRALNVPSGIASAMNSSLKSMLAPIFWSTGAIASSTRTPKGHFDMT